jgi:hypothetical protein
MNRSSYIAPKQPEFSLPQGFFVDPGAGRISSNQSSNHTFGKPNSGANQSQNSQNFNNQNNYQASNQPRPNLPQSSNQSFSSNQNGFNPRPSQPFPARPNLPPNPQPKQNFQPRPQPVNPQPNPALQLQNTPKNYLPHPQNNPQLTNQPKPNLPPPPQSENSNVYKKTELEEKLDIEEWESLERESYHTKTLLISIIGLLFYFLGAFLMIFVNNVGGEAIVNLTVYKFSWELFFTDPGRFIQNLFLTVFGYFFQYARLFGFFPELGNLTTTPVSRYLLPVDIAIKLATILYFHLKWMPWDTARTYRLGAFNSRYPYLTKTEKAKQGKPVEGFKIESINIPASDLEKQTSAPQQPAATQNISANKNLPSKHEDDDDDDDDSIIPFSGVQKPLEEWYHQNELKIYTFVRKNILPGSNLVLALYFSTLRVLDFRQPQFIILYVLVIMSMFWCMQTFLLILDHTQFQPEEDHEVEE